MISYNPSLPVHRPYTMTLYLRWYMRWVWLFNIKGEPYGNEELEYLTRKSLQLSVIRWEVRMKVCHVASADLATLRP